LGTINQEKNVYKIRTKQEIRTQVSTPFGEVFLNTDKEQWMFQTYFDTSSCRPYFVDFFNFSSSDTK